MSREVKQCYEIDFRYRHIVVRKRTARTRRDQMIDSSNPSEEKKDLFSAWSQIRARHLAIVHTGDNNLAILIERDRNASFCKGLCKTLLLHVVSVVMFQKVIS